MLGHIFLGTGCPCLRDDGYLGVGLINLKKKNTQIVLDFLRISKNDGAPVWYVGELNNLVFTAAYTSGARFPTLSVFSLKTLV